ATPPASAVGRSCHRSPLGRATSPATVATLRTTGVRTRETMSATPRDGTSGPPTPATSSRHRRDSLAVIVDHGVQDFVDPDLGLPADRTIDLVERRDAPRHVLEVLLVRHGVRDEDDPRPGPQLVPNLLGELEDRDLVVAPDVVDLAHSR